MDRLHWLEERVEPTLEAMGFAVVRIAVTGANGRRLIAGYMTVPAYAAYQAWLGRAEALKPMQDAWAAGDRRGALAAIPAGLVDELVVHGEPESCRERVAEYRDQGLDTPVIAIVPVPGVDPAAMVPRLAPR